VFGGPHLADVGFRPWPKIGAGSFWKGAGLGCRKSALWTERTARSAKRAVFVSTAHSGEIQGPCLGCSLDRCLRDNELRFVILILDICAVIESFAKRNHKRDDQGGRAFGRGRPWRVLFVPRSTQANLSPYVLRLPFFWCSVGRTLPFAPRRQDHA
jgi:hypothetical protein